MIEVYNEDCILEAMIVLPIITVPNPSSDFMKYIFLLLAICTWAITLAIESILQLSLLSWTGGSHYFHLDEHTCVQW